MLDNSVKCLTVKKKKTLKIVFHKTVPIDKQIISISVFFKEFSKQQSTLNRTPRKKKNFCMSSLFFESRSDLMSAIN